MHQILTYMTIADMCKRHTELNVLVCCLSREKEQSKMGWKATDGFHVPQQSYMYPHFVTSVLKNFRVSNFCRCRPLTKCF